MQRCLSGLRSTIGNRVTGGTRPEVRILFSAPLVNKTNPDDKLEFVLSLCKEFFAITFPVKK